MNKRLKVILILGVCLCIAFAVVEINLYKPIVFNEDVRIFVRNMRSHSEAIGEIPGKIEVTKPTDIKKAKKLIKNLRFRTYDDFLTGPISNVLCQFQIFTNDAMILISSLDTEYAARPREWSVTINPNSGASTEMIYTLTEELNEQAKAFIENLEGEVIPYGEGYGDK